MSARAKLAKEVDRVLSGTVSNPWPLTDAIHALAIGVADEKIRAALEAKVEAPVPNVHSVSFDVLGNRIPGSEREWHDPTVEPTPAPKVRRMRHPSGCVEDHDEGPDCAISRCTPVEDSGEEWEPEMFGTLIGANSQRVVLVRLSDARARERELLELCKENEERATRWRTECLKVEIERDELRAELSSRAPLEVTEEQAKAIYAQFQRDRPGYRLGYGEDPRPAVLRKAINAHLRPRRKISRRELEELVQLWLARPTFEEAMAAVLRDPKVGMEVEDE